MALYGALPELPEPVIMRVPGKIPIVQDDVDFLKKFMESWTELKLDKLEDLPHDLLENLAVRVQRRVQAEPSFAKNIGMDWNELPKDAFDRWYDNQEVLKLMITYLVVLTGTLFEQQGSPMRGDPAPA